MQIRPNSRMPEAQTLVSDFFELAHDQCFRLL